MIVMKFGGTSVEDARAIGRLVNLVRERLQQRPVIVASALAGVTDALLHAASTATGGNQSATQELLERLESRHIAIADNLLVDVAQTNANISQLFTELRSLLGAICALRDIHQIPGLSAQVFSALDGIEVWLALTSASPRSLSLVTSERDMPEVVRRLHHSLLEDNCPQLDFGAEKSVASAGPA